MNTTNITDTKNMDGDTTTPAAPTPKDIKPTQKTDTPPTPTPENKEKDKIKNLTNEARKYRTRLRELEKTHTETTTRLQNEIDTLTQERDALTAQVEKEHERIREIVREHIEETRLADKNKSNIKIHALFWHVTQYEPLDFLLPSGKVDDSKLQGECATLEKKYGINFRKVFHSPVNGRREWYDFSGVSRQGSSQSSSAAQWRLLLKKDYE